MSNEIIESEGFKVELLSLSGWTSEQGTQVSAIIDFGGVKFAMAGSVAFLKYSDTLPDIFHYFAPVAEGK